MKDQPISAATSTAQLANAIRALAMDAVEAAKSGHPGMPMGMAEIALALWRGPLRYNPAHPRWPDRDRFVLSNGHGSMLLYALLHLTGYDLPMAELKRFRQLGSKTPGHPEVGVTPGVETTTGPLGQGLANAVGMALAERLLAATFNRPGHTIVDHHTYVVRRRRLPDGGDLARGLLARRHLGPGQTHRLLRRQRDFDRRRDQRLVHRRHGPALRRLWLARAARSTVTTWRRWRRRWRPRRPTGQAAAAAVADLQDGDRQGRADQGRHAPTPMARRWAQPKSRRPGWRSTGRIRRS